MPVYDYRCQSCGKEFTEERSMEDAPLPCACPFCNKLSKKIIKMAVPVVFKGDGFYSTSKREGNGNA